jgi:DnaJ-domain-containing protein 1
VFLALFALRLVVARRDELVRRWPALVLGGAAVFAVARGMVLAAGVLAVLALVAWRYGPRFFSQPRSSDAIAAARAELGVGPNATESDIRRAYRERMASAHPDRGGAHGPAARLTAARDLLLRELGKRR